MVSRGSYIQKSSSQHLPYSNLQIRIGTDNSTILPSQLHQTGLEILAAGARDFSSSRRASCEIDLADFRVLDHSGDHLGGILRTTGNDIQAARRETCVLERAPNGPVTFWGEFGGFDDSRVPGSESTCCGANTEDVRCIPGCVRLAC